MFMQTSHIGKAGPTLIDQQPGRCRFYLVDSNLLNGQLQFKFESYMSFLEILIKNIQCGSKPNDVNKNMSRILRIYLFILVQNKVDWLKRIRQIKPYIL